MLVCCCSLNSSSRAVAYVCVCTSIRQVHVSIFMHTMWMCMLFSVSSAHIYTHSYGQLFMHMYGVEGSRTYANTCRHAHTHTNLFRLPGPRTLLNLQRALELVHSDGSMHCGVIFCTHECECMCMRVCVDGKHIHTHTHIQRWELLSWPSVPVSWRAGWWRVLA